MIPKAKLVMRDMLVADMRVRAVGDCMQVRSDSVLLRSCRAPCDAVGSLSLNIIYLYMQEEITWMARGQGQADDGRACSQLWSSRQSLLLVRAAACS